MIEKKRKKIILAFIGALALLFLVVGGTYAYFQIIDTNNEKANTNSDNITYAKLDNSNLDSEYSYGENYKSEEYYDRIEKISFVNYVPSDEELSSLNHWDLSDTESGTPENSVIGWLEKSENKGYSFDNDVDKMNFTNIQVDLYNLYIGSNSKIYIKDLSYAFEYLVNVKNIDFSNLNTSETTYMSGMFRNCISLSSLDLSTFDTSKVTDMSNMFSKCRNLTTLDLSTFDTSKVKFMGYMFQGVSVDLPFKDWPKFVTMNVEQMRGMFNGYQGTTLDLSTFDTSQVTDMNWMFCNNGKLNNLDLSSFTFENLNSRYGTFSQVPSSCKVKIKSSQKTIFESKFPLNKDQNKGSRTFTPIYVD